MIAADGFRVSAEIVRGTPAEEVLREASLWRSDLVAVRTRSASARDNRVGGMASALLHHATCPVLTVPAVPEGYRLRRILIPVDFSPASRRGADWGLALAEVSGAVPVLLHIVGRWVGPHGFDTQELVEIAREELERWRAAGSPSLAKRARETHVLPADDVADGILRFTEEGEHDLVVMASTGASAVRAILVGSNARRVVRASSKPVLVVTASNRVSVEEFLEKQRRAERFDSLAAGVRAEAPAAALRVS